VPGEFTGPQVHSSEYDTVGDLSENQVLVVGAGNSSFDIDVDVAQHPLQIDVVMRKGRHFQAKAYFGVPRAQAPFLTQFSPDGQDLINRLLARVSIGESKNYPGMPMPEAATLADGTARDYDSVVYATKFDVALPFLDDDLIAWSSGVPVRYTGGIPPSGAEKLYFIGLIAPRGPQIPVYGARSRSSPG
jgi:hypothetical protein